MSNPRRRPLGFVRPDSQPRKVAGLAVQGERSESVTRSALDGQRGDLTIKAAGRTKPSRPQISGVEMEKLLFKVPEVAEALSLSESKTYELVASGVLRSVVIDGSRRVRRVDLDEYVANLNGTRYGQTA